MPIISSASTTAMVTNVSVSIWEVFYANFALSVGFVVLMTIVIAVASWLVAIAGIFGLGFGRGIRRDIFDD